MLPADRKQSRMIRVTETEEPSCTKVILDGEISGESIAVVETCCNQARSNGKPVQLFLRHVTAVDQAGQMLLSRLAAEGIRLVANGLYTSYLVQALTCSNTSPCPTDGGAATLRRMT